MDAIFAWLGAINPLYAIAAMAVYVLFGDRIKSLLGSLGSLVPKLGGSSAPAAPVDPTVDPNAWLEQHPLLDRIWVRVKDSFGQQVLNGKVSEDDAYTAILAALKTVLEPQKASK